MKNILTKKLTNKSFYRSYSVGVFLLITLLSFFAAQWATKLKTQYSMKQFQPETHKLLLADQEINKKYNLFETSSHALLLSLKGNDKWTQPEKLNALKTIVEKLDENEHIIKAVSLANVKTAIVDQDSFYVGQLSELSHDNTNFSWIYDDSLITPSLVSQNGQHAVVFVTPDRLLGNGIHEQMMDELKKIARKEAPFATAQVGGPAAIRTQITQLLGDELGLFVVLSLIGAIIILLSVFRGFSVAPVALFIIIVANLLSLGWMAFLGVHFTLLSTTVPILVTITAVAITTHTLVRLGEDNINHLNFEERATHIVGLFKELFTPHLLTASTTAVGFGTLVFSDVPLIREYGLSVASGVILSAFASLTILSATLNWIKMPKTRRWISSNTGMANWIINNKVKLLGGITSVLIVLGFSSPHLQWTGKLFDDIPNHHESRKSTDFISKNLGGVVPFNISIGTDKNTNSPWKSTENINKLDTLVKKWRTYDGVGSAIGLPDFVRAAQTDKLIPKQDNMISETFFVYSMGAENPLRPFLTPNEFHTRVALRISDLPANESKELAARLKYDAQKAFPNMTVQVGGIASTLPVLNESLSKNLMFGFFHALFWIVLLLSFVFKSLRWALVAVIPNLVPPVVLLGALAITGTPIKPGIAIIFAISLGLAFDNTVYILGRLKCLLEEQNYHLPIRRLISLEASPCFVSSFSLMAGFSIFMFSHFSMNQTFGCFMLLSISASLVGDLVLLPVCLKLFPQLLLSDIPREKLEGLDLSEEKAILPTALSVLLVTSISFFIFSDNSIAAPKNKAVVQKKSLNADKILKKVKRKTSPPNESVKLNMKIKEPDGSIKERSVAIYRKNGSEKKALVRILEPTDLKGVALLSIGNSSKEDQWLYLPASKRSRRIVGSGKTGRFLDSELSYEDMRVDTYSNFTNKFVKTTGKKNNIALIESIAKRKSETTYGKIKTWVNLNHNRIEKVVYFDKKGKKLKTMTFNGYKKLGKKYWRAKKVHIVNSRDKRATTLELKSVSLKKLSEAQFSMSALEEG